MGGPPSYRITNVNKRIARVLVPGRTAVGVLARGMSSVARGICKRTYYLLYQMDIPLATELLLWVRP